MTTTAIEQLTIGMRRTTSLDYAEADRQVREALKAHGFGVLTEIDVQATLKAKLGVDFPRYEILGACNPAMAHRALTADPEIGLLLPCNVVVREAAGGTVVEAMDPVVAMALVRNEAVEEVAREVRALLAAALAQLPA
jgi:uncharacterized protein (DUF302 family)